MPIPNPGVGGGPAGRVNPGGNVGGRDPFARWMIDQTKPLSAYAPTVRDVATDPAYAAHQGMWDYLDKLSESDYAKFLGTATGQAVIQGTGYNRPDPKAGAYYDYLRNPTNAQAVYNLLQSSTLGDSSGAGAAPGGVRDWMTKSFAKVKTAYDALGPTTDQSWLDFARNYHYGSDYYDASPKERGFYLGGNTPSGRIIRGY